MLLEDSILSQVARIVPPRQAAMRSPRGDGGHPGALPTLTYIDKAHNQVSAVQVRLRGPAAAVIRHGMVQVQHKEGCRRWLLGSRERCSGSGPPRQPQHLPDLTLHVVGLAYSQSTLGKDVWGTREVASAQHAQSQAQQPEEPGTRSHLVRSADSELVSSDASTTRMGQCSRSRVLTCRGQLYDDCTPSAPQAVAAPVGPAEQLGPARCDSRVS